MSLSLEAYERGSDKENLVRNVTSPTGLLAQDLNKIGFSPILLPKNGKNSDPLSLGKSRVKYPGSSSLTSLDGNVSNVCQLNLESTSPNCSSSSHSPSLSLSESTDSATNPGMPPSLALFLESCKRNAEVEESSGEEPIPLVRSLARSSSMVGFRSLASFNEELGGDAEPYDLTLQLSKRRRSLSACGFFDDEGAHSLPSQRTQKGSRSLFDSHSLPALEGHLDEDADKSPVHFSLVQGLIKPSPLKATPDKPIIVFPDRPDRSPESPMGPPLLGFPLGTPNSHKSHSFLPFSPMPLVAPSPFQGTRRPLSPKEDRMVAGPLEASPLVPDLTNDFERPGPLIRSVSNPIMQSPEGCVRSPCQEEEVGTYALPFLPNKGSGQSLKYISPDVVGRLWQGDFSHVLDDHVVVDCRFSYEYQGGHIAGAIHCMLQEQVLDLYANLKLFKLRYPHCRFAVIFHCEFSKSRAPNAGQMFRTLDRSDSQWPALAFPEVYIMEGGYQCFYETFKLSPLPLMTPPSYVKMWDEQFTLACKEQTKLHRASWLKKGSREHSRGVSLVARGRRSTKRSLSNFAAE